MEKIRIHHLLCLPLFVGEGYSDSSSANMGRVKRMLNEDPDRMLEIVCGPDLICANCPNLQLAGSAREPGQGKKLKPESESGLKPEPKPGPKQEPELKSGPKQEPEPKQESESGLKPEPKSGPKQEPEPKSGPKQEPEPKSGPKQEPELKQESEPELKRELEQRQEPGFVCREDKNHVVEKDRELAAWLGIQSGDHYTWKELLRLAAEQLTEAQFTASCGRCRWYRQGLCSYSAWKTAVCGCGKIQKKSNILQQTAER